MGNLRYNSYEEDAAVEEASDLAAGSAAFMKLKVGRNILRILPPPEGQRTPFRVVFQHFIDIAGQRQSVVCAKSMARKPCPVCQKIDQLRQSKSPADHELASALYARRRVFANVIDRSDEEKGPKILGFGKSVHEQLVALRTDAVSGGDYVNPEAGYDVVITRTGTGKNDTKYHVGLAKRETPLSRDGDDALAQEWIDTQSDHANLIRLPAEGEVRQLLSGEEDAEAGSTSDEADDEEATRPVTKQRSAVSKAASGGARASLGGGARSRLGGPPKRRTIGDEDAIDVEGEVVDE